MQQSNIDVGSVTAQTAGNADVDAVNQIHSALHGESQERIRLYKDEEWRREGNNKPFRDPVKAKRIKKIAAASRRRNRRA